EPEITRAELSELAREVLVEEVGQRYADSFAKWQVVNQIDRPLIILIGGATGVGKSTVASQLAGRLGITRVIPTDAIREVMRSMFSEELMPTLHTSSFDADHLVRHPLPRTSDRYLEFFDNIRKIQRYVKSLALERNVPIVHSYSLDATLAQVIELVVSRAMQGIPSANGQVAAAAEPRRQARGAGMRPAKH